MFDLTAYRNRQGTLAVSTDDGSSIVLPNGTTFGMAGREAAWTLVDLEDVDAMSEAQERAVLLAMEADEARERQAQARAEAAQARASVAAQQAEHEAVCRMASQQRQLARLLRRVARAFPQMTGATAAWR